MPPDLVSVGPVSEGAGRQVPGIPKDFRPSSRHASGQRSAFINPLNSEEHMASTASTHLPPLVTEVRECDARL
jgi:hypothetical protein